MTQETRGTDAIVADARMRGAHAERQRVIRELRNFAEECTVGIPPHLGVAFSELINEAAQHIAETGGEIDRANDA